MSLTRWRQQDAWQVCVRPCAASHRSIQERFFLFPPEPSPPVHNSPVLRQPSEAVESDVLSAAGGSAYRSRWSPATFPSPRSHAGQGSALSHFFFLI